jgi:hypothetical protein
MNPIKIFALLLAVTTNLWAASFTAVIPGSKLTYTIKHPMHTVVGVNPEPHCIVETQGDSLGATITCKAAVSQFDSGNENRDSHMLETVEALDFPEVVFSGAAKEKTSTGWKIVGELTFHGITRPLEMEMKKTSMNGKERFVGTFTLKLSDFNVDRPSLLFVSVTDEFRVDVDLLAP